MGYPSSSERKDLHLRYGRGRDGVWEELPSTSHFVVSLRTQESANGKVYGQGVFLDSMGKELSPKDLASLVDVHGPEAIHHLDGDFVIAVEDRRHGVWCATDPSAAFPLYYKLTRDELVITTRAENMRAKSAEDLDLESIATVLSSGYPWGDMTLLKDWKTVRPGHMIRIDRNDNAVVTCYFDPENDASVQGYQAPEELVESVDRSLRSIASRYSRILIPLSGGVDSRLVAVRCHALGIPFEAITFVANVPDGADFDIATRLVKVFGLKHYRWQWDASTGDCLKNFNTLCYATGGTNDAYTSYPDGMSYFAQVAADFDCIMRGDHVFGMGPYSDSLPRSAWHLNMKVADNMDWALRPEFHNKVKIASVFEKQEGVPVTATGDVANAWRHVSYRKSRSPRFLLPIGQLQAQFTRVTYPFLSKEIVARLSRTETKFRDEKRIAREALAACSPPDIKNIPFANLSTWRNGEPLLSVAPEVLQHMIDVAAQPGMLAEVVDASAIIASYTNYLNSDGARANSGWLRNIKKKIKSALPASVRAAYDDRVAQNFKAPPPITFKRFYAMKVYLDRISQG